jgi:hydrogenase/urease accessory protein HupE
MKLLTRHSLPFALYLTASAVALAHPGHEGHTDGGFTWDLSHLAAHPLATLSFAVLAGVAAYAGWHWLRNNRRARAHTRR